MSDWIDELVDAQLDTGPYRLPADKCKVCGFAWHGLPTVYGCDGTFSARVLDAVESQGVMDWTEL